jgi:hypothetical protein
LQELRRDIDKLNHENESLRLENLAARDARMAGADSDYDPYRQEVEWELTGLAKFLLAVLLAATAGAGGYYFARMQLDDGVKGVEKEESASRPTPRAQAPAIINPLKDAARPPAASVPAVAPAPAPVPAPSPLSAPEASPPASDRPDGSLSPSRPPASAMEGGMQTSSRNMDEAEKDDGSFIGSGNESAALSPQVEKAMMKRARDMIASRDLGAARMIYVYLARKGSAIAMTALAESYDLRFLRRYGFDVLDFGDPQRARRLYGVASSMGDERAASLLEGMGQ